MSKIEWTEKTWNPTVGCSEVSPGCTNCYAAKMAYRLQHMGQEAYAGLTKKLPNGKIVWTGEVRTLPDRINYPLTVKKPTTFFVDSMSDLFHADVPFEFIEEVFIAMARASHHTFQVLTKRAERMAEFFKWARGPVISAQRMPENIWMGVSVENQKAANERIPYLLEVPAAVRFLSCEPLLGPIEFSDVTHRSDVAKQLGKPALAGIHWVICGGESGPGARPMHPDWARSLRDQCEVAGVAFFFKQWGAWVDEFHPLAHTSSCISDAFVTLIDGGSDYHGLYMHKVGKAKAGRLLDGQEHNATPTTK